MASKGNKSIATAAANLANLLPTGTVLAFEALIPSFSKNGECLVANKYLTLALIIVCSLACFFSSFTDCFVGKDDKLYYGIATRKGIYIFNDFDSSDGRGEEELNDNLKATFKIDLMDFVHAVGSLIVFLVFAISSSDVQNCFFQRAGPNEKQLFMNLPLGAGILSTFLFSIFPTRRRGIGCGGLTPQRYDKPSTPPSQP